MKHLIRILLGIAVATALVGAATATPSLAPPAEAATSYVSTKYTAPKRGQTNAGVKALQRRLIKAKTLSAGYATGYFGPLTENAVRKFQRRYGLPANGKVSRRTWSVLVAKTGRIKITSGSSSGTKISSRCKTRGRVLCIDKTRRKLYYVKNGTIISTTDARFGCARTRTREGTFRVFWKSRHHVSTIYHTPMPYAMFFSGGQAVHYSADFAARGYNGCSHGCVNIRDRSKIAYIYSQVRVGDKVVVYRS